jgi:hypothetical protein
VLVTCQCLLIILIALRVHVALILRLIKLWDGICMFVSSHLRSVVFRKVEDCIMEKKIKNLEKLLFLWNLFCKLLDYHVPLIFLVLIVKK